LPLVHSGINSIRIIDVSQRQLELTQIRWASAKFLARPQFLELLGYSPTSAEKRIESLKSLPLPSSIKESWIENANLWAPRGFLFIGRWEHFLIRLGEIFRSLSFCDFTELFETKTLEEQKIYMQTQWPAIRLRLFLRLVASPLVFHRMLYKGALNGGRSAESLATILIQSFESLLSKIRARESFFLQMLFLGSLPYPEGWPAETHTNVINAVQNFQGKVIFENTDLVTAMESDFDFASVSDVISYLDPRQLALFFEALQKKVDPSQNVACVARSFLKHPATPAELEPYLQKKEAQEAQNTDNTGVYRFHIYRSVNEAQQ
ncbi:MAG: hypothetical protein COT73_00495, partial [Bdellovibrio sp. CG10_big_fil_rev_8_21_14_0_10_47_8]